MNLIKPIFAFDKAVTFTVAKQKHTRYATKLINGEYESSFNLSAKLWNGLSLILFIIKRQFQNIDRNQIIGG